MKTLNRSALFPGQVAPALVDELAEAGRAGWRLELRELEVGVVEHHPAAVASKGDLARMLSALGRDEDAEKLRQLRRLVELEQQLGLGIDL